MLSVAPCARGGSDARVLGHRRRPALQDPPLHEHRGRRPAARAVRAADRSRGAGESGRRPGSTSAARSRDLNAPLPLYRFNVLLQKANEVCNDVKTLGSALLAALEKKDAEATGAAPAESGNPAARSGEDDARESRSDEAKENLEALKKNQGADRHCVATTTRTSRKSAPARRCSRRNWSRRRWRSRSRQVINIAASIAHIVPIFDLGVSGFGGSPKAAVMFGGPQRGQLAAGDRRRRSTFGRTRKLTARTRRRSTLAHERRWDDWKLQERLAEQGARADRAHHRRGRDLRVTVATKELENHVVQIENAKATDEFMRSKYTNQELYQWQIGQISGVYFQSYKLAYDLAKRAERCFRFELGAARQQLHQLRLLGQPEEGPAVRRKAPVRPAPARDRVPRAEPPRVRADQAHLAAAARPAWRW